MKNERLYLKTLRIQNFATFKQQEIHFSKKFNTIVGETGSGKSLILDALELVFGARAEKKSIRKDAEFSSVEAIFHCQDEEIKNYFQSIGHPFEGNEVVVKRVLYRHESSKSYLNFQSCPLSQLTSFSKRYIDLVGQFENQKLLSDDYQLVLLDNFSTNSSLLKEYQSSFQKLNEKRKELLKLEELQKDKSLREDFLKFQLEELEKLSPSTEDENDLITKKEKYANWQKVQTSNLELLQLLSEGETANALTLLSRAIKLSHHSLDSSSIETLERIKSELEDLCFDVSKSLEIDFDEKEYEDVIDRLDTYQKLKRKYSVDTAGLVQMFQSFSDELEKLHNIDKQLKELGQECDAIESEARTLASSLHESRINHAKRLSKSLTASVQSLKMVGASLNFQVSKVETLNYSGFSHVTLMAETNPGEGFFKIKDIASGGELSRILLALRQILSTHDSISVFLFDEIDTGVGGETALAVGSALETVAQNGQVIAITHLPQIANFSDHILNVSKDVDLKGKKTLSKVQVINTKKDDFIKQMSSL